MEIFCHGIDSDLLLWHLVTHSAHKMCADLAFYNSAVYILAFLACTAIGL